MTLAVDHPKATFPAWANLRAPATGHFTYASMPLLVALISPTYISVTSHSAARASACRSSSFSIEMSIPTILSSAVLVGVATLTAVGSSTFVRCIANCNAFSLPLSPDTFLIPIDLTPISVRGMLRLAVAIISAYDVFVFAKCVGHRRRSLYAGERGHSRCRRRSCFHCSCAAAQFG
jgi:hypothetical protein